MPRISEIMLLWQPQQYTISIHRIIKAEDMAKTLGECFSLTAQLMEKEDLLPTDAPYIEFMDYMGMTPEKMELRMGFAVNKPVSGNADGIEKMELPGRKLVMAYYRGAYSEIMPVYEEMHKWMAENNLQSTGSSYEYYYNDDKFPESEYLTKILIPVK